MLKNLNSGQLLLIGIVAVLLLLAGFSFYLLQNPRASLPFTPSEPSTSTPSITAMASQTFPSETATPRRQTSYTPFATLLTPATATLTTPDVGTLTPQSTPTVGFGSYTPSVTPTRGTPAPTNTPSATSSPAKTSTTLPGELGVTGRVLQNGTPVANVIVEFKDDVAPRQASTNSSGHYWFTTLAPGTSFTLTFRQSNNPQLIPAIEVSSLGVINGNLPTGINTIDLPDFEVSLNIHGTIFDTSSPMDGAVFSASVIGPGNPIQFLWSLYNLGETYRVELGPYGSDQPIWNSNQLGSTYFMWDGTLNDGSHISQGTYWWRVAVKKGLGNYIVEIYTQPWDIFFNP